MIKLSLYLVKYVTSMKLRTIEAVMPMICAMVGFPSGYTEF